MLQTTVPSPQPPDPRSTLLQFVDFKWLMAGEGHHIDVHRLQHDRAYARGCLALAQASTCTTLRDAADQLGAVLRVLMPQL
jgi:hypothetical protein